MKTKIIIILISLCSFFIGYAQEVQYEEYSIRVLVGHSMNEKDIKKSFGADSVLNVWITNILPSFPSSKDEMLRRVYHIDYICDRRQIERRLLGLSWIDEIMPIEKVPENMLYTPSDFFWKITKTTDPTYLWYLTKIEAEKAWDITKGSGNIKIAILDMLIDASHSDLKDKMVYDYDPYTPSVKMESDGSNHGTTVAGFAAASTDDPESSSAKLASIGFNCKIVGYYHRNFLEKIHHAAFVEKASVIVSCAGEGIRSTPQNSEIEKKVVKEILDNGTIIVAPAGNGWGGTHNEQNGKLTSFYPFHPTYDDRIIIVSSTDINDNHTYIKNGKDCTHSHFEDVTVCAPGYSMMGAFPNNAYYKDCSGTSFAAPIVAGLCGLMKSVYPDLTPAKAKEILTKTADPINDANLYPNMVGSSRINAYKAVLATKQYAETCHISYVNQTISNQVKRNACTLYMKNTIVEKDASISITVDNEALIENEFSVEEGAIFEILTQ